MRTLQLPDKERILGMNRPSTSPNRSATASSTGRLVTPLTSAFAHYGEHLGFSKPERSMTEKPVETARSTHDRVHTEMLDSFDEELELEIDDDRLDALTNEFAGHTASETVDRRLYFKELFRLQGELVKPSGGIPNPNDPSGLSRIGDAAVFGVTTTLRY
jgi:hypothetical protein